MKISVVGVGFALALSCLSTSAFAQWMWKDDAGHIVASDQPPPKNIPPSRIMHAPPGHGNWTPAAAPAAASASGDSAAPSDDANKVKTTADKELDFQKRQKKAADDAKKAADDAAKNQAKADRCSNLQKNINNLASGQRISEVNNQGERSFMDDSTRQAQLAQMRESAAKDCS